MLKAWSSSAVKLCRSSYIQLVSFISGFSCNSCLFVFVRVFAELSLQDSWESLTTAADWMHCQTLSEESTAAIYREHKLNQVESIWVFSVLLSSPFRISTEQWQWLWFCYRWWFKLTEMAFAKDRCAQTPLEHAQRAAVFAKGACSPQKYPTVTRELQRCFLDIKSRVSSEKRKRN